MHVRARLCVCGTLCLWLAVQVKVTYKKFGRSVTVPLTQAPTTPTRAARRAEANTARHFARLKARTNELRSFEQQVAAKASATA